MSLLSISPTWPTVEQALLGSASLLRAINIDRLAATKENDPVDNTLVSTSRLNESIQISPVITPSNTGLITILSIKAQLYYDSSFALRSGFDVFDCIISFSNEEITEYIDCSPIPGNYQTYPVIPSEVKTLEQFFLYNVYLLMGSTYPKIYVEYKIYDVPDSQAGSSPHIFVTLSLPFDYQRYCLNRRFIDSLTKLFVNHYSDIVLPPLSPSRVNNDFRVNNSTRFNNGNSSNSVVSASRVNNDFRVNNSTRFNNG